MEVLSVIIAGAVFAVFLAAIIAGHHVRNSNHDLRRLLKIKRQYDEVITEREIDKTLGDK